MSSLTPAVRRRVGGGFVLASAAALVITSLSSGTAGADVTASAAGCPTLHLDNPPPGAQLSAGDDIVSGAAVDPNAPAGSTGVSRVDLFFGARETGGILVGSAIPGQTSVLEPGQQASSSSRPGNFTTKVSFPAGTSRGDNLIAYAYSSSSGAVTSVSVPILVGVQATPTPTGQSGTPIALHATTATSNCNAAAGASAPAPAAPPAVGQPSAAPSAPAPASQRALSVGTQGGPVFRLDNPRPNDLLPVGDTLLQGLAFDPAASSGSGVDRVEFFIGDRNKGGFFIGGGAPGTTTSPESFSIKVTINSNQNGHGDLFAYAHSAVTGAETALTVPVNFGVGPTPTPRP